MKAMWVKHRPLEQVRKIYYIGGIILAMVCENATQHSYSPH